MGTLYIVATPIGNINDISLRALEILQTVDFIYCEDTRETIKILNHFQKETTEPLPKLISYNDYNAQKRIPEVIAYLEEGKSVALTSDRGTPLLSDPGYKLVREVIHVAKTVPDVTITSIPGASALLPALQLSGFPPDKFYFGGFLPKKTTARKKFLEELPKTTIVLYESPHRINESLLDIIQVFTGHVQVAACIEITKAFETVFRGTAEETLQFFNSEKPRGEITLVIDNHAT